jgi:hypothetical protein
MKKILIPPAFALLALGLFAAACGDLQQRSGTATDQATIIAEDTATPRPATATTEPVPSATTAPVAPTAAPVASPQSLRPGDVAAAGEFYSVGAFTFRMPPGASLATTVVLSERLGNILVLYDPVSGSSVKLDPGTGIERSRYVTEARWNAVFDFVADSIQLVQ